MDHPRVWGRVAVLAAALPLSGCAAAFGGYDVAANGLPREEEALRRSLAFEADALYAAIREGEQPLPDDDLLRLLYAGTAGYYAGSFRESGRLLDMAAYLAEDRVTFGVSEQALSMITSDRTLAYTPARTERLMIPYLAALTYLEAGDLDGAAVEARRIEALLDRLDDGLSPDEIPADSRFLHYFAGTVFEAARDRNAAAVAYRRSGAFGGVGAPTGGPDGNAPPVPDSLGEVVVLVAHGFVPHRVEQSVVVVLPPAQAARLTDGSIAEKAAAAAAAAGRILLAASGGRGDYRSALRLEPWRHDPCESVSRRVCEEADGKPYLLRLAWPILYPSSPPSGDVRVRVGDAGAVFPVTTRLDLTAATRRDFEAELPAILARTVLRAATKMGLSASVEDAVSERDRAAGQLLGILTNLGTFLTERADTRAWHLLPASVSLVRLRLPPGRHALTVEMADAHAGRGGRGVALGTVQVQPGTTTFLTTRLWR